MTITRLFGLFLLSFTLTALAGNSDMPDIRTRTNAENYRDRALAYCIATAYKGSPAGQDASFTTSAYLEWTEYDYDRGNQAVDKLTAKYLSLEYTGSDEGYAGAKFNLMKCIDMYHSPELAKQVRKYVANPNWIGDQPPKTKRKKP